MAPLSILSLVSFFSDEQKSLTRGKNHYKSNHIESSTYSDGIIGGQVHASMKKKVYKVTFFASVLGVLSILHSLLSLLSITIQKELSPMKNIEVEPLTLLHFKIRHHKVAKDLQELGLGKLETYSSAGNNIKVHYFVKQPVPEIDSEVTDFASKIATVGIHLEGFKYAYNRQDVERNWRGGETANKSHFSDRFQTKPGPDSKLTLEEEFLIVMIRLKVGLFQKDLAHRFGMSEATISRVFTSWINLMYIELNDLCEMPDCESSEKAKQFGKFPMVRVILDCTEIYTEKPSSVQANKAIYSHYKSHNTFKYLVGISPHPAVVYVSRAWGGRGSDKHITSHSQDLIDALKPGEQVMVDRGFAIESILLPKRVELVIPDFKGQGRSQLTEIEEKMSEKIAEARIHVERAMQRIKMCHILDNEFKLSMAHLADQIFTVCFCCKFSNLIFKVG
ncbi:uncharacterized protein [Montipora foliosa]|uniref:uncharacterized protein n=1 Tax=Montipora foliosa TaxID=591990 RepID=UPI0035F1B9A9